MCYYQTVYLLATKCEGIIRLQSIESVVCIIEDKFSLEGFWICFFSSLFLLKLLFGFFNWAGLETGSHTISYIFFNLLKNFSAGNHAITVWKGVMIWVYGNKTYLFEYLATSWELEW